MRGGEEGGEGGGGGSNDGEHKMRGARGENGEGVDEACNTVPLLAVDLSARSIRWRKRRSREFHGDYHSNDSAIRSRPPPARSPRNNDVESKISRYSTRTRRSDVKKSKLDSVTTRLCIINTKADKYCSFVI